MVMGFIVWDSQESASWEFYFVFRCLGTISIVGHFAQFYDLGVVVLTVCLCVFVCAYT